MMFATPTSSYITRSPSAIGPTVDNADYEMPILVEETLAEEHLPLDVGTDDGPAPLTYQVVPNSSKAGTDMLVDSDGYTYGIKKRFGDRVAWRCPHRTNKLNCKATVNQCLGVYTQGKHQYNHQMDDLGNALSLKINAEVKTRACADLF